MTYEVRLDVPEDVAKELILAKVARRKVRDSRSTAETILLTLGAAGSVVALLQGPATIRDLVQLLRGRADMSEEIVVLEPPESLTAPLTISIDLTEDQMNAFIEQVRVADRQRRLGQE